MRPRLRICFVALWLVLIFVFSAQPDIRSYEVSGSVSFQLVKLCNNLFHANLSEQEMETQALRIEYPVRKAAHMSEYAVLSLLFLATFFAYSKLEPGQRKVRLLCILSLLAVFGCACLDEFHQLFVQGREGKFTDVLIDSAGAATALLVAGLVMIHKIHKKEK